MWYFYLALDHFPLKDKYINIYKYIIYKHIYIVYTHIYYITQEIEIVPLYLDY